RLLGGHARDTDLTSASQCVIDGLALRRPFGDRGRAPVLRVVGVRHEQQRGTPVDRERLQHGLYATTPCTTMAVVCATHSSPRGSWGCSNTRKRGAAPT